MNAQTAYHVLVQAEGFRGPMVGFGAQIPEAVRALLRLLDEPDAAASFKRLLEEANLPGQLYALCGLYYVDHGTFLEVVEPYRHRSDQVMTQSGCIVGCMRVSEIVESTSRLSVCLDYPTQSMDEWREQHPDVAESAFDLDIIGGGWTAAFRAVAQS